jgi:UDP-GlcNAc:undecaprenyl-phosphate GlcNAc-1-phosphate transferase
MMSYKTYLAVLVVSAVGAFWLTPLAAWLARKLGAMDIPNARKVHQRPTPRLGGVAVVLGFCLPWAGLYFLQNPVSLAFQNYEKLFAALMVGAFAMLALGIYDDCKGADAAKKFAVQTVVAVGLWMAGFQIRSLDNPWSAQAIYLSPWFGLPLTVLWIVGLTNAINLLDGIDGLVAGVTACIGLSLAIINAMSGNVVVTLLTLALAGACLGFLPHNHSPARIFLGDSGSLTIGLVLACIGVISVFNPGTGAASPILSVPIILFSLPIFDTLRVMLHRLARGVSMFQADKNHVHHRLLELGLSQRQAAWLLYAVAAFTGLLAIVLTVLDTAQQVILSSLFALLAIGVYWLWRTRLRNLLEDDAEPKTR